MLKFGIGKLNFNCFLTVNKIKLVDKNSNIQDGACQYAFIVVVLDSILPDVLYLTFLVLFTDIYFADLPFPKLNATFHIIAKVFKVLGTETQNTPNNIVFIVLMLINSDQSIISCGHFQVFLELELQHFYFRIQLFETRIVGVLIKDINQCAMQTFIHHPEVREIVSFVLALGEN